MIEVIWTAEAKADLAAIDEDYAAVDPDYADRVGALAIAGGRFLAQWPDAGSDVGGGERKWPVKGTAYRLFYRIYVDRLEITRVRHAKEDWRPL